MTEKRKLHLPAPRPSVVRTDAYGQVVAREGPMPEHITALWRAFWLTLGVKDPPRAD